MSRLNTYSVVVLFSEEKNELAIIHEVKLFADILCTCFVDVSIYKYVLCTYSLVCLLFCLFFVVLYKN